jgi:predicted component of type VI protein secretion system
LVLIDDGYRREGTPSAAVRVPEHSEALAPIACAGALPLEEVPSIEKVNRRNTRQIRKRADELAKLLPGKEAVFAASVRAQEEACASLESHVVCVTWVLEKPDQERSIHETR